MSVYFSVLAFIILVCFIYPKGHPGWKLLLCIIPFFVIIAIRVDWGGDYESYEVLFNYFKEMSWGELKSDENRNELGFRILVFLSPTYRHFLILTSLLLCAGIYFFFYKIVPEKYWPYVFVLLFIDKYALFGDISGIRNGLAVSFFLAAVYYLMQGKKWIYAAIVLAGSLFHTSIIIFLPLFFVTDKKLKLKPRIIFAFFGLYILISALTPGTWANMIDAFFAQMDSFSKYNYYMENTSASYSQGTSFILAIFLLYVIVNTTQLPTITSKEHVLLKLSFLWFIIRFFPSMGMSDRLFFYADYLLFAASTVVVGKYPDKTLKSIFIFGLFLYYLFYFYIFTGTEHFLTNWLHYRHCL